MAAAVELLEVSKILADVPDEPSGQGMLFGSIDLDDMHLMSSPEAQWFHALHQHDCCKQPRPVAHERRRTLNSAQLPGRRPPRGRVGRALCCRLSFPLGHVLRTGCRRCRGSASGTRTAAHVEFGGNCLADIPREVGRAERFGVDGAFRWAMSCALAFGCKQPRPVAHERRRTFNSGATAWPVSSARAGGQSALL